MTTLETLITVSTGLGIPSAVTAAWKLWKAHLTKHADEVQAVHDFYAEAIKSRDADIVRMRERYQTLLDQREKQLTEQNEKFEAMQEVRLQEARKASEVIQRQNDELTKAVLELKKRGTTSQPPSTK